MGWCNELASTNIKLANNTLIKDERIAAYKIVQQEFTKDLASIPLFNRTETYAISADLTGFAPVTGQEYYNYNAYEWQKEGSDTVVLGFTQEPATLFTLVESAMVSSVASQFLRPEQEVHLNYDYKAVLVKELPTIENGGTVNNDVEVKEGDKVLDADGNPVTLAAGMKVKNAAGETVEFTGGTIMMKQLVSKFEFVDGLTWEDGVPVSAADLELSKKISCDPESGATTFISCDKTANTEFFELGYTQTWIPGVQDPLYFVPNLWGSVNFPLYPAHQVISDGRKLADVPAKEWVTLTEVAEKPMSFGPYKLVEWVKGEKLVYDANPYWIGPAPKSPNLVIQIITAESAESLLLGGEVDVLDSTTLAGLSETLVAAEAEGKIKTFVEAGGTWEHIDINLFVR
jgi:ABC-type transport system substrate-binding protein